MAAAVVRLNETLSRGLPSAQLNKFLTERRRQDARDMKLLTSTPAGVPQGGECASCERGGSKRPGPKGPWGCGRSRAGSRAGRGSPGAADRGVCRGRVQRRCRGRAQ